MAYTLTEKPGIDLVINGTDLDIKVDANEIAADVLAAIKSTSTPVDIDVNKLEGEDGAHYLSRANHTGSQLASTISDFNAAVDNRVINTTIPGTVNAAFVNQLNVDADTVDGLDAGDLLDRQNHTGEQSKTTITNFDGEVNSLIDARVISSFINNLAGVDADTLNGATAADVRDRSTHTGTQGTATISGLSAYVSGVITADVDQAFVNDLDVDAQTLDTLTTADLLSRANHTGTQDGTTVTYDNTGHDLVASNVQAAIDELDFKKVDVSSLASNIVFYYTTASSGVLSYNSLVTSTEDPDYDDTAVNVATGAITASDQQVAAFVSEPGVIVGNPGVFSVTTIGNVRRTDGNDTAEFYFKVFQRDQAGNETELAESGVTPSIDSSSYIQFAEYALINNGTFADTDRIVIKWFANRVTNQGGAPEYDIEVGGNDPARTLFPVPVTVIPAEEASEVIVDTASFGGVLSGADDSVQKALDTIDDHTHTASDVTDFDSSVQGAIDASFIEGLGIEIAALDATGAATDYVLTSDGDGTASWQSPLANVTIEQLNDVNYSFGPPVQGDQLIYNETTGTWQPQTPVGAGDMLKSIYDSNDNDIVDKAETLDDGSVSVAAQETRDLIDSDPVGQAVALSIALG